MTRAAFSILSLALGALAFGTTNNSTVENAASHPARQHFEVAAGTIARAIGVDADDDRAEVRRRIRDGEAGTYIGDILNERDSSLARWPDRSGVPLSVWIQPTSNVVDFTPEYARGVRDAFEEWGALNLPVQFRFVSDSARAEVHVNWIDRFDQPISGRTRWARDDEWVITDANIVLAMHHNQGDLLDRDASRAMALHEIGHLLGLDHTKDTLSIMAPKVRVRQLSSADRATVRLVYTLPAGPLR